MYANENDGATAPNWQSSVGWFVNEPDNQMTNKGGGANIMHFLRPYTSTGAVLTCPTTELPDVPNPMLALGVQGTAFRSYYLSPADHYGIEPNEVYGSYAYNMWMEGPPSAALFFPGLKDLAYSKIAQASESSTVPIFGEGEWSNLVLPRERDLASTNFVTPRGSGVTWGNFMRTATLARHGDSDAAITGGGSVEQRLKRAGTNYVFVDGHAEYVPMDGMWGLRWHKGFDPRSSYSDPLPEDGVAND